MKGIEGYSIKTIICRGCGKTSSKRRRPNGKYCSLSCYRTSEKPERKTGRNLACEQCGTVTYVPLSNKLARFCSTECQSSWQGRHKDTYICKICHSRFRWSPSRKAVNPTYCGIACRNADPEHNSRLRQMNAAQAQNKTNKLEQRGYDLLSALNVHYIPQCLIAKKFCVDAFFPDLGIVIQFDGEYWHGHPERFPNPSQRQLRRMLLDKSQDAYLTKLGYTIVRFWETDIWKNPGYVTATLVHLIAKRAERMPAP